MLKLFKKPIIIGKVYTISDLNTANNAFSLIDIKSKIRILIIDDEEFVYKEALREENYNIKCIYNIDDLCAVSEYPIVICDIKGVGTNFSKEKEGAYVVSELKKKYPFKQIAVYSGLDYKLDSLNDLDGIIRVKKDVSIDTWRESLNELIRRASDPKENWKTIRNFLLNNDVSIKDVLILVIVIRIRSNLCSRRIQETMTMTTIYTQEWIMIRIHLLQTLSMPLRFGVAH